MHGSGRSASTLNSLCVCKSDAVNRAEFERQKRERALRLQREQEQRLMEDRQLLQQQERQLESRERRIHAANQAQALGQRDRLRRREVRRTMEAALVIQRYFRGWQARCRTRHILLERRERLRQDAQLAAENAARARRRRGDRRSYQAAYLEERRSEKMKERADNVDKMLGRTYKVGEAKVKSTKAKARQPWTPSNPVHLCPRDHPGQTHGTTSSRSPKKAASRPGKLVAMKQSTTKSVGCGPGRRPPGKHRLTYMLKLTETVVDSKALFDSWERTKTMAGPVGLPRDLIT